MKNREDSFQYLWDTIKRTHIHIRWVSEGEERKKGTKKGWVVGQNVAAPCFLGLIMKNLNI